MIDLNLFRTSLDRIKRCLEVRNIPFDFDGLLNLDRERRRYLQDLESLNHEKNKINDDISLLLKDKKDTSSKIEAMKDISQKISAIEPKVADLDRKFFKMLMLIPNIPSEDTPVGKDHNANKIVRESNIDKITVGKKNTYLVLSQELGIVDLKRASKISGSSFVLFMKDGARLERALINFMLDTHIREHGYQEVLPPFLVNRSSMEGTGQLPRFEEDMYRIYRGKADLENGQPEKNDLFLIPTAEVPVTNIHREEILKEEDLPIRYVAYTPCFRWEAGSYGKETQGMIRVHQFDKVELVKFCRPEDSSREHESLVQDAERIFQLLGIPYRVVLLSTADLGFAAAKCYDIEVWAPGLERWLEASSCSDFGDFQSRRASIKYKEKTTGKTRFVHTLNGSGVALARTFIALLENQQQSDGSILIPDVLRPYLDGKTHIKKR